MIKTAYLRVYESAAAFSAEEQKSWTATPTDPDGTEALSYGKWLITGHPVTGEQGGAVQEGAYVRTIDGTTFICPWRTRLRMLAGLLAFRESIPEEVAEAFVPESEARRAAQELARLDERRPPVRSHILHANWHVPLRWFAAFDGSERILIEDRRGLRIRYETRIGVARARLARAIEILNDSMMDEGIVSALEELSGWLTAFSPEALLELDYGSVASMFSEDELVEENCAALVGECLDALGAKDGERAGRIFGDLTDRWAAVRAHEVVN
jgi:hypothetical protein